MKKQCFACKKKKLVLMTCSTCNKTFCITGCMTKVHECRKKEAEQGNIVPEAIVPKKLKDKI